MWFIRSVKVQQLKCINDLLFWESMNVPEKNRLQIHLEDYLSEYEALVQQETIVLMRKPLTESDKCKS